MGHPVYSYLHHVAPDGEAGRGVSHGEVGQRGLEGQLVLQLGAAAGPRPEQRGHGGQQHGEGLHSVQLCVVYTYSHFWRAGDKTDEK